MWVWTWGNTHNPGWANVRWDDTKLVQGNSGWVISSGALDCECWPEGWLLLQARLGDALLEGPLMESEPCVHCPWVGAVHFLHVRARNTKVSPPRARNTKVSPPRIPGMDRKESRERGHGSVLKEEVILKGRLTQDFYESPLMMTWYARQQKRHRCKEQTFGLCGRKQGWDGWLERIALKHVPYHMWNRSPVQVGCMR